MAKKILSFFYDVRFLIISAIGGGFAFRGADYLRNIIKYNGNNNIII